MSYDTLSKFIAEEYSQDLAAWLVGEPIQLTELKSGELSLEPTRADSVILLKSSRVIMHVEFQTDPDPDMAFRMADYALRIYRKFPQHRLVQVVIYLRKTNSDLVTVTTFQGNNISHSFRVIRLWEQETAPFLERPGLWPYAVLTRTADREATLRAIAQRIDGLSDRRQQSNLSAISGVLAGLSLEESMIQRILRRDLMRESTVYQAWQAEAEQRGRHEGRQEEGRSLILRLLTRRFGALPQPILVRIEGLSLEQLETLGEALFDFTGLDHVLTWLESH